MSRALGVVHGITGSTLEIKLDPIPRRVAVSAGGAPGIAIETLQLPHGRRAVSIRNALRIHGRR